jgi:hypothetical protein
MQTTFTCPFGKAKMQKLTGEIIERRAYSENPGAIIQLVRVGDDAFLLSRFKVDCPHGEKEILTFIAIAPIGVSGPYIPSRFRDFKDLTFKSAQTGAIVEPSYLFPASKSEVRTVFAERNGSRPPMTPEQLETFNNRNREHREEFHEGRAVYVRGQIIKEQRRIERLTELGLLT